MRKKKKKKFQYDMLVVNKSPRLKDNFAGQNLGSKISSKAEALLDQNPLDFKKISPKP